MIRRCSDTEFEVIWDIINEGARAYEGAIPEDCWKNPYMSKGELRHEIGDGVLFWAKEEHGRIRGVMGLQRVKGVALIRHAYVRTQDQRQGVGTQLLTSLRSTVDVPVLIGAWADATWAIDFYRKHGFQVVDEVLKTRLLGKYWNVPKRQVETSVVLVQPGFSAAGVCAKPDH